MYIGFPFPKNLGYLLFPTSETLRRMSTCFGFSDIWDRAFEWTSDSYGYEWLLVFKAAITQSKVTLVHRNDPRNRCAESLYPFLLQFPEREITYTLQGGCPYTLCSVSLGEQRNWQLIFFKNVTQFTWFFCLTLSGLVNISKTSFRRKDLPLLQLLLLITNLIRLRRLRRL